MKPVAGLLVFGLLVLAACSDAPEPSGDPVAGEQVLAGLDTSCGLCHTLESAGFTGSVGPNLDQLAPGFQRVLDAMREGPGAMPSYANRLTDEELRDLAAYISSETSP